METEADVEDSQHANQGLPSEKNIEPQESRNTFELKEDDPRHPYSWSASWRWTIVLLISLFSATAQMATIIAAPIAPTTLRDLHSTSPYDRTLMITVWEIGEIVAILACGPLSEVYGRLPIFHITNGLFIIFSIGQALAKNMPMLIAFRFLTSTCIATLTLGPAVVGDLFPVKQRGLAMTINQVASLCGPVVGPIVGSYLGQDAGWRWAFWLITILMGAFTVPFLIMYRETYKVTIIDKILRDQAKKSPDEEQLRSKYSTGATSSKKIVKAMFRPYYLLAMSPALLSLTLYLSIVNGFGNLVMAIIAPIFQTDYGFSEGAGGLAYLGFCIGLVTGSVVSGLVLDKYIKLRSHAHGQDGQLTPEHRLPAVVFASLVMPTGFFMFGWTAQQHVQWMAPIVGTGIIGLGWTAVSIATRSYIVDAFGIHAASATAASLVPRNVALAVLPLAGPPLYARIGLGWGNSVLAFVMIAFIPLPLVMLRFGKEMRREEKLGILT